MRLQTATILQFIMKKTVHMVQLPPAEPNEAHDIETFARLSITNSQLSIGQLTNGQPITNTHNNNENNTLLPDSQSNTIPHKFSKMTEELKISPNKSPTISPK